MKSKLAVFLLFSIGLLMNMSIIAAADTSERPDWALDPDKHSQYLEDFDLYEEDSETYYDPYSEEEIDVWYQIWLSPKGCYDDSEFTCDTVLGIAYIETSEEISEDDVKEFKDQMDQIADIEDVTDEVPNAKYAFVFSVSYYGYSYYLGFVIFNTMKHYLIVAQASVSTSSDTDINPNADEADLMKELMVATGYAAQALFPIPGYDLLIILGLTALITTGLLLKKSLKCRYRPEI